MKKIYSFMLLAAIGLFGAQSLKATTVYFVNTADWATVKGYAFTGEDVKTSWPGDALTATGSQINGHDVFSFDLGTYATCIFNNGDGAQTADMTVDASKPYCLYVPAEWPNAVWFASAEAIEASTSKFYHMYVRGSMNGDWGLQNPMTQVSPNIWKGDVALSAGDVTFKFDAGKWNNASTISGSGSSDVVLNENTVVTGIVGAGQNFKLEGLDAGTYTFVLDVTGATPKLAVSNGATYALNYDGNGATGGSVPVGGAYDFYDEITVVGEGTLVKDGCRFIGWNTAADGAGTPYNMGGKFFITSDVTLYAQWNDGVTYELNGGVTNEYGWTNASDMFDSFMSETGATGYPSLEQYKSYEGNARFKSPTGIGVKLTNPENAFANTSKWGWLKSYIAEVQNAQNAAGLTPAVTALDNTGAGSAWRYAVAAFFVDDQCPTWPVSANFATCGAGTLSAYQAAWGFGYANPQFVDAEFTLNAPYKAGYAFAGWYDNAEFTGTPVTTIDENSQGTLYAKWDKVYIIYFYDNMSWGDVHVNLYAGPYWNNENGSGNNGAAICNAQMTKIGETNYWKYEFTGGPYSVVSFTSIPQYDGGEDHGYEHFYNCDAVYREDFDANSENLMFVSTTDWKETHNSTGYYSEGIWMKYGAESYSISVNNSNYRTLCLPYAATLENATAYSISAINTNSISITPVNGLAAATPYIIKPTIENGTVTATYSGNPIAKQVATANIVGNLNATPIVVDPNGNNYVLSANELHKVVSGGEVTVAQYKAFFYFEGGLAGAPALRIIEEENNVTNIQNIEGNEAAVKFIENGKLFIKKNGVVYDAVGTVVR